jgi:hypothetical protein
MKQLQFLAAAFFALSLSVWLGRAETHTDDTGILIGLIGIGGFLISMVEPKRPWLWGVIVPAGIILGNLWRHSQSLGSVSAIAGLTIAVGCAGAYAGSFVRRHVSWA